MPLQVPDISRVGEIAWKASPDTFAAHLSKVDQPPITGGVKWRPFTHSVYLARRFRRLATTPGTREIWNLPPRYGKSLVGSIWGPAWMLDLWPSRRVITLGYGDELPTLFGRDVRNLIAHGPYRDHLRVELRADSTAAGRWNTPQGGGFLAAGLMGGYTGFGADLLVIDDPFKNWEEAQSATIRRKVWETWLSTVFTRLQPSASVLIIQTRWHEEDLTGNLVAQDEAGTGLGWQVIRLPAIAEPPDPAHGFGPDPLDRPPGAPLCPEMFDLEYLEMQRRTSGSYVWAGTFQQRPSPDEGGVFKRSWWRYWTRAPHPDHVDEWIGSWDMSFKDEHDSSYVVGQVWARVGSYYFLMDQVRDQMEYVEARAAVKNLAYKWQQCRQWLVEDTANGPAIMSDLRGVVGGMIPITPKGSKAARARSVSPLVEAGDIWLPGKLLEEANVVVPREAWVAEYVEEHAAFPNAAHDDQVDATSQALSYTRPDTTDRPQSGVQPGTEILEGRR